LNTIYHDGHLLVQYNPIYAAQLEDTTKTATNTPDDNITRLKNANFGFKKVEILNGNIGYINLNKCWAGKEHGLETIKAALKFVANSNAIIIDVRENGGGSQETVTLIIGYFLNKATHIESFYDRSANSTTEYWTTIDSSFTELINMPLYILTSNKSFSCAEMLAYDLQALKRATIIGEVTGGGAHGEYEASASNGFVLHIPYWRGINPITKTNWEGVGVKPDIETSADNALEVAEMHIVESLVSKTKDSLDLFNLKWELDLLKAINHPIVIDTITLKKFAGVYGERVFTFEKGKLFYQRTGKPKFELEPMTPTTMKGKGNNYFIIEFVENKQGEITKVIAYYQDNRIETSIRNK